MIENADKIFNDFINFLKNPRKIEEVTKEFGENADWCLNEVDNRGWQVIRTGNKKIYLVRKDAVAKRIFTIIDVLDDNKKKSGAKLIIMPNKKEWKKIRIIPLGDINFAHPNFDLGKLKNYIDWIKRDEYAFCFINGNCFASVNDSDTFFKNLLNFKKISDAIESKILFMVNGPNEIKMEKNKRISVNPLKWLAEVYNIPFFQDQANVAIRFGTSSKCLRIFAIHGKSNATKVGGKINAPLGVLDFVDADIVVMSNLKYTASKRLETFCLDPKTIDILQKKIYIVLLPSFLKYEGSEDAIKGYPPYYSGQLNIAFYREKGDYHVFTGELKKSKNGGLQ